MADPNVPALVHGNRHSTIDGVDPIPGVAPLASPALTGSPTAPTATTGDSTTKIATTALVAAKIAALGLGTASTHAATDFDTAGAAATAQTNSETYTDGKITTEVSRANAAYDAIGAAAAVQAVSQPLDSDLTAIAVLNSGVIGAIASDGSGWVSKTVAQFRTWLGLATVAISGAYADLSGKPSLATVATSGAYADLSGKPSLVQETVNTGGNTGTAQTIPDVTTATMHTYTLTGNCVFTMPTAAAGKSFTVQTNSGAGSFTAVFTGVKWNGGTAPTASTAASAIDLWAFICVDGTNWIGSQPVKAAA